MFENLRADLNRLNPSRSFSMRAAISGLLSQGFQAILIYRIFNFLYRKGVPGQPVRFLLERFIEITTGISIPAKCNIGGGFRIHHFGGIIFHPTTRIGENCTVYQCVTIGDRGGKGGAACIGNNVLFGAGAKIIGEITIGDNVIVGANAVVTRNVPPNTVVSGSPARYRPRRRVAPSMLSSEPVRVMDLRGTYKGGGGPDKTILNSAALHDPTKVWILVTYLRRPDDRAFLIAAMAAERKVRYNELVDRSILDTRCIWRLRRLIRTNRIQVLHTHDDKTLLYGFLLRCLIPGLRILHTCHSHAEYERRDFDSSVAYWKYLVRKRILLFFIDIHHKPVLTISGNTRARIIRAGLNSKDVIVVPNGIDTQFWQRKGVEPVLRKELRLGPDAILVGTVARLAYDKDLPCFFEVARRVNKMHPETVFAVVGDGHGTELMQSRMQVEELQLGEVVRFTGHRNDLKEVYASLDLFLMTSLTEGMPNTILEAMAMEVPVVSTAVGGVPELLVDGDSGILCPVRDVAALTSSVSKLITDEKLRNRLRVAARLRSERYFDFARRVKTMEDVYCRFAESGRTGMDVSSTSLSPDD